MLTVILVWLLLSPRVAKRLYLPFLLEPQRSKGTSVDGNLLARLGGQTVWFASSAGHRLRGHFIDKGSRMVLFYCMGNDGDLEKRADSLMLLTRCGLSIFIYEYSGFGKSEGKPSLDGLHRDAADAFAFLCSQYGKEPDDLIFYGESLGGAVVARLARQVRPAAMILKSTFASLSSISRQLCPLLAVALYPSWLFPRLDTAELVRSSRIPTMIVHGWGDRKIKWSHASKIYAAGMDFAHLLWLADSRHAFMTGGDRLRFIAGVKAFVQMVESERALACAENDAVIADELGGLDAASTKLLEAAMTSARQHYLNSRDQLAVLTEAVSAPVRERSSSVMVRT